jgi:ADP-ribosylglycohydrolase
MEFPHDYIERAYAGVLGKIIGVYLGRPVEGWSFEQITRHFGEVDRFVHSKVQVPLVVTDDDLAGTFTFIRALEDYGFSRDITARQIGQTWLNYIIEDRAIIWWGGLYHSTEHTAFLNLKSGIAAPESGSIARNGHIIANQIGAQIYIDGWAMVSPGDPEGAVRLARQAASVSHDDEAVNAACLIAAMEAQAFIEPDIQTLIDTGLSLIPSNSLIYRLVMDLREWREQDQDWRKTRQRIVREYGYKKYVGGCHIVPNHALIQLGLLYGGGDLRESLKICITSGWDTDCNAGNLGCLLGIRSGLDTFISEIDWRTPVADRIFLATADGGSAITDAVLQTDRIVRSAYALRDLEPPTRKGGRRFHFDLPGALQGFQADIAPDCIPTRLQNIAGKSRDGKYCLQLAFDHLPPGRVARTATATFILPEDLNMGGYELIASPTIYSGQTAQALIMSDGQTTGNLETALFIRFYDANDQPAILHSPPQHLSPDENCLLEWQIPEINGCPIFQIGVEIRAVPGSPDIEGCIYLDWLDWTGEPSCTFSRPAGRTLPDHPMLYRRAWAQAVDHWDHWWNQPFRIIQDRGRGMISIGTRQWRDYAVSARVTSAKFQSGGIAVRVQGLKRFYALLLVEGGKLQLLKALDGNHILAECDFHWDIWKPYEMRLEVIGNHLRGWIDGKMLLETVDEGSPLSGGGIALVIERGHLAAPAVHIEPLMAFK